MQVVWTGGDRTLGLWCAYTGVFLGCIDKDKELGLLAESASFAAREPLRTNIEEAHTKMCIDTSKVGGRWSAGWDCVPPLLRRIQQLQQK